MVHSLPYLSTISQSFSPSYHLIGTKSHGTAPLPYHETPRPNSRADTSLPYTAHGCNSLLIGENFSAWLFIMRCHHTAIKVPINWKALSTALRGVWDPTHATRRPGDSDQSNTAEQLLFILTAPLYQFASVLKSAVPIPCLLAFCSFISADEIALFFLSRSIAAAFEGGEWRARVERLSRADTGLLLVLLLFEERSRRNETTTRGISKIHLPREDRSYYRTHRGPCGVKCRVREWTVV